MSLIDMFIILSLEKNEFKYEGKKMSIPFSLLSEHMAADMGLSKGRST